MPERGIILVLFHLQYSASIPKSFQYHSLAYLTYRGLNSLQHYPELCFALFNEILVTAALTATKRKSQLMTAIPFKGSAIFNIYIFIYGQCSHNMTIELKV